MAIVLYLAMTAAEFHKNGSAYPHLAWMACHFSPYGTGLSNLPAQLPAESILMVNDRTPIFGHDPQRVAAQLTEVMELCKCSGILLDLQRPRDAQSHAIAKAIAALPYPVAATPTYAQELECGVILPPIPLTTLPQEYLNAWQGREIWLEMATERYRIRVDPDGNHQLPEDEKWEFYPHKEVKLHCCYGIDVQKQYVDFHLQRNWDELIPLMTECENWGVSRFVGLYQQLGAACCQALAQDTALSQS